MPRTEVHLFTMPDDVPTYTEGYRVAPNEGLFPLDATVNVLTEDEHFLTFKIYPKGPAETDHLISLVESDPPLSSKPLYEKEVYVQGDILIHGREFNLHSALPILSKTAFKAMRIFSNVETLEIPVIES